MSRAPCACYHGERCTPSTRCAEDALQDALLASEHRVAALESALQRYGMHENDCPMYRRGPVAEVSCTCGFEVARDCLSHAGTGQVGCERDDGTLNIHAYDQTCEVCATAKELR